MVLFALFRKNPLEWIIDSSSAVSASANSFAVLYLRNRAGVIVLTIFAIVYVQQGRRNVPVMVGSKPILLQGRPADLVHGPEAAWDAACRWAAKAQAAPLVREALEAARHEPPVCDGPSQGWVRIALQNAFFELLHAPSLEEGVVATVRRGGDTDTNAAVAGALLGAVHGRAALPAQWAAHPAAAELPPPGHTGPNRYPVAGISPCQRGMGTISRPNRENVVSTTCGSRSWA